MLSRRHLRIKVMQALYAFSQSEDKDLPKAEKELLFNLDRMYDLFLLLLSLPSEMAAWEAAHSSATSGTGVLSSNTFISCFASNSDFGKQLAAHKISWQKEQEMIGRLFRELKKTEGFKEYAANATHTFREDQAFAAWILKDFLLSSVQLSHFLEENHIFWTGDVEFIGTMAVKFLKSLSPETVTSAMLPPLLKDREEDLEFLKSLFLKTVIHSEEYEQLIAGKTKNWDVERIAVTDTILLKMALCEVLHFPSVPVKVSINEYIEISKEYSTPKSKMFINGIIDKIVSDLRHDSRIHKAGRGLME